MKTKTKIKHLTKKTLPVNGHFQMNVGWPTAPWY